MGLFNRPKATPPTKPPKVAKKHCLNCNGRGSKLQRDYDQPPNKVGSYPMVDVRCRPCNGQGWTAVA